MVAVHARDALGDDEGRARVEGGLRGGGRVGRGDRRGRGRRGRGRRSAVLLRVRVGGRGGGGAVGGGLRVRGGRHQGARAGGRGGDRGAAGAEERRVHVLGEAPRRGEHEVAGDAEAREDEEADGQRDDEAAPTRRVHGHGVEDPADAAEQPVAEIDARDHCAGHEEPVRDARDERPVAVRQVHEHDDGRREADEVRETDEHAGERELEGGSVLVVEVPPELDGADLLDVVVADPQAVELVDEVADLGSRDAAVLVVLAEVLLQDLLDVVVTDLLSAPAGALGIGQVPQEHCVADAIDASHGNESFLPHLVLMRTWVRET